MSRLSPSNHKGIEEKYKIIVIMCRKISAHVYLQLLEFFVNVTKSKYGLELDYRKVLGSVKN